MSKKTEEDRSVKAVTKRQTDRQKDREAKWTNSSAV